jgi:hypothetical protein
MTLRSSQDTVCVCIPPSTTTCLIYCNSLQSPNPAPPHTISRDIYNILRVLYVTHSRPLIPNVCVPQVTILCHSVYHLYLPPPLVPLLLTVLVRYSVHTFAIPLSILYCCECCAVPPLSHFVDMPPLSLITSPYVSFSCTCHTPVSHIHVAVSPTSVLLSQSSQSSY